MSGIGWSPFPLLWLFSLNITSKRWLLGCLSILNQHGKLLVGLGTKISLDLRNYNPNAQLRPYQFSDPYFIPNLLLQITTLLASNQKPVRVAGAIGLKVYSEGIKNHIVDLFALSDPLLARLH